LNCATGPEFMTDHIRTLAQLARTRVACVPNAGLPDENGRYLETPEMLARTLARFGENGWLNLLGGCCGTHRGHIARLAEIAPRLAPRPIPTRRRSSLSGVDPLEIGDDVRPVIVGERTNVLGSKKFRDLIALEKWGRGRGDRPGAGEAGPRTWWTSPPNRPTGTRWPTSAASSRC